MVQNAIGQMTPSEVNLQLEMQLAAKPGLSKQFTFQEQSEEHVSGACLFCLTIHAFAIERRPFLKRSSCAPAFYAF